MQLQRFGFIIKLFMAPFKYFLKHAFKRGFIWNAFYFSFGTLFYLFQHCALEYLTKASSLQEYTVGQKMSGSVAKMSHLIFKVVFSKLLCQLYIIFEIRFYQKMSLFIIWCFAYQRTIIFYWFLNKHFEHLQTISVMMLQWWKC